MGLRGVVVKTVPARAYSTNAKNSSVPATAFPAKGEPKATPLKYFALAFQFDKIEDAQKQRNRNYPDPCGLSISQFACAFDMLRLRLDSYRNHSFFASPNHTKVHGAFSAVLLIFHRHFPCLATSRRRF